VGSRRLGLPERERNPLGHGDDAAPTRWTLTRGEESACPKSAGALGDFSDVGDLDLT
jgi:hypothetical protein